MLKNDWTSEESLQQHVNTLAGDVVSLLIMPTVETELVDIADAGSWKR